MNKLTNGFANRIYLVKDPNLTQIFHHDYSSDVALLAYFIDC